ncbi:MAG: hypothetical protein Q7K55_01930 [Candidatus Levybacteria bacterium]|nr:hypothetical protein [Candidatus Levybacteria bacterium]
MKITELFEIASRFRGINNPDNNPTNSLNLEDVTNTDLREYLTRLDRNLSGRINGDFAWASNMRSYCSLFAEPLNIKVSRAVALYEQIRKEDMVTPEQIKSPRGHNILAFKREQLLAIGALVWADGQKSEKEPDIIEIARKAIGESSIKDFIHKSKLMEPDSNEYQEKPAQQQRGNDVQVEKPAKQQKISEAFEKVANPKDVAYYTREELIKRFGQTPNSLDCALVENNLPEGADSTRKIVVISVPLYKALMEIAAYHNNKPYRQREIESSVDGLTNRGVCQLIKMCVADLEDGYKNVGQVLATIRKAKGV